MRFMPVDRRAAYDGPEATKIDEALRQWSTWPARGKWYVDPRGAPPHTSSPPLPCTETSASPCTPPRMAVPMSITAISTPATVDWMLRLEQRHAALSTTQWLLHQQGTDGWIDRLSFTLAPHFTTDYVVGNHFVATHPKSPRHTRLRPAAERGTARCPRRRHPDHQPSRRHPQRRKDRNSRPACGTGGGLRHRRLCRRRGHTAGLGDILLLGKPMTSSDRYPILGAYGGVTGDSLAAMLPASTTRLAWGALLGVLTGPLYLAACWHLYRGLCPARRLLSLPPFLLLATGFALAPFVSTGARPPKPSTTPAPAPPSSPPSPATSPPSSSFPTPSSWPAGSPLPCG